MYPLVIKHGKGKSPVNGCFNRTITLKWPIFQPVMFDYQRVAIKTKQDEGRFPDLLHFAAKALGVAIDQLNK